MSSSDRTSATDDLQDLLRRTTAMLEVSRELQSSLSLDVLLPRMVALASALLDAESGTIFLLDKEAHELYTRASLEESMREVRFPAGRGIAGAVLASGKAERVPDPYRDPRFLAEVDARTGIRTRNLLCVPLRRATGQGDETVGVVQLINKRGGQFTGDDLRQLEEIATLAASCLVNAQVHQRMARDREEELRLLEVTSELSSELKLRPLLEKIMQVLGSILAADKATLFMHDRATDALWALVSQDAAMATVRFPASLGIAGRVFSTGETINIPDAYQDPRFNREVDRATGYTTRSILCMPIVNRKGRTIGVTQLLNKKHGVFSQVDEKRLRAFSAQAAIAIENAQLFDEVVQVRNYNESILQSMSNGVVTVDAAGAIVRANAAACRLLRCQQRELEGRLAGAFFAVENAWIAATIETVQRTGKPDVAVNVDILLGERAGPDRRRASATVNLSVVPLDDGKDTPAGCMLMFEDLTEEKRLKSTMARYMTKEVADRLLEEGADALGGRLQKASVLFSDIRGFTAISERIGPQETVRLLNEYFGIMVDVILERGGILDKYIGDAIMAVFGVPFTQPEDADHAVQAAIEMVRVLGPYNRQRLAAEQPPVHIGLGISTDEVLCGNIGSLKRMDYTVIGDGVNLAARLESANVHYGTQILLSEQTVRELKGSYRLREIDRIQVKGKSKPVGIFEVLDHVDDSTFPHLEEVLELYGAGLQLYRARAWSKAQTLFEQAFRRHPDGPCKIYSERCERFLRNPPEAGWTGVWVMKEK